ncbi:hypothetical protein [Hyalangium rubrum]|uniref:Uncharacterized protein n=1 Tax=Hyalangium rubrum TaxID=3103134 RepID=A0ABU5H390_9BACT|nr:hypothetical protein [Hyalangium sp. s54d21]MDY7227587.1 hypothetical protein [Hyalangium sp. s54d21]
MNAVPLTSTAPVRSAWLVDRRHDLLSTVGGLGASLLLLALHVWGGISGLVLWWAWIVALDGPHIFATLSRTYLDRRERQARRRLLWGSLGWFALGPALFGLSVALGQRLPFDLFLAFVSVWAYWHVVRQHYGLMSLYQRKNADMHPLDRRIDSLTLYVGLLAPFLAFALTHPTARRMLGLGVEPGPEALVAQACWAATLAVVALFAARQVQRWRAGLGVNGPKVLLLAAALGLSALLFTPAVVGRVEFLMVSVVVTAFHNVQYHGIVWFYHRNRYHAPGADPSTFGLAPRVSQRFLIYLACGVAFTLLYRGLGCGFGAFPGCGTFDSQVMLGAGLSLKELMAGFIWGFAMHHYYLDQKIWRVSRDTGLNRDLKLSAA